MTVWNRALRGAVAMGAVLLVELALTQAASAENHRNHVGLAVGYQGFADRADAAVGGLSYRYSSKPAMDWTLDLRVASVLDENESNTSVAQYLGPGIRLILAEHGVRPYSQFNVFWLRERATEEHGSAVTMGFCFGFSFGIEIRASDLVTIPLGAIYLTSSLHGEDPSIGVSTGLTFSFGEL